MDSTENRIQTPEPYSGVRGLRHGPGAEAPQPLAHGPPGLHPELGLGTSTTTRRSSPPHRPVPGVPATLALGTRPARDPPRLGPKDARPGGHTAEACVAEGPSEAPAHPPQCPRRRTARTPARVRRARNSGPGGSRAEPRA